MIADLPILRPFAALHPTPGYEARVVAPPYDVLTSDEARRQAAYRPYSFLHVSKAEVDLPPDIDPYAPAVYAKAAENLNLLMRSSILVRESRPCFYVYRMIAGTHVQTGVVGAASVTAYKNGRIRRHELTLLDKEDDRVRLIEAVSMHTSPVLAIHYSTQTITTLVNRITSLQPLLSATLDNRVEHIIWRAEKEADITTLLMAFVDMPAIYIADGHHRSAAAERIATARQVANHNHRGDEMYNSFLLASFPADEMIILDYNLAVRDINGLDKNMLLTRIAVFYTVTPSCASVRPATCSEIGMYLPGQWYRLMSKTAQTTNDPVACLGISRLVNCILTPVLGIVNLRCDKRIAFIGGIHGLEELERLVNSCEMAAAFAIHPPKLEELVAVANAGCVMPPKATWFEPKLADGLLLLPL